MAARGGQRTRASRRWRALPAAPDRALPAGDLADHPAPALARDSRPPAALPLTAMRAGTPQVDAAPPAVAAPQPPLQTVGNRVTSQRLHRTPDHRLAAAEPVRAASVAGPLLQRDPAAPAVGAPATSTTSLPWPPPRAADPVESLIAYYDGTTLATVQTSSATPRDPGRGLRPRSGSGATSACSRVRVVLLW